MLPRLQPDMPQAVAEDLARHTWRSFTSSLEEVVYRHDPERDADCLPPGLPVFCLHGDGDRTAPLRGVLELACGRDNWSVQVLPGMDHHPMLRDAEACLTAIRGGLPSETA